MASHRACPPPLMSRWSMSGWCLPWSFLSWRWFCTPTNTDLQMKTKVTILHIVAWYIPIDCIVFTRDLKSSYLGKVTEVMPIETQGSRPVRCSLMIFIFTTHCIRTPNRSLKQAMVRNMDTWVLPLSYSLFTAGFFTFGLYNFYWQVTEQDTGAHDCLYIENFN